MKHMAKYNAGAAVEYAHKWAHSRNPAYYDFENIGGDCTNFVSQCLYAGGAVMNFTKDFGWYYINANSKAPAWTGVSYLYNFLTRSTESQGPAAHECPLSEVRPGDIIQLLFTGSSFQHTPFVVAVSAPHRPQDILIAAHSYDADYRPLSLFDYKKMRCLHIDGIITS
ncbi:MAG: amidase domain-containing protein [Oscillospiraceae bacterium]|nr:amidase domain-containing protein [Oscillospiraceae bacterium]